MSRANEATEVQLTVSNEDPLRILGWGEALPVLRHVFSPPCHERLCYAEELDGLPEAAWLTTGHAFVL